MSISIRLVLPDVKKLDLTNFGGISRIGCLGSRFLLNDEQGIADIAFVLEDPSRDSVTYEESVIVYLSAETAYSNSYLGSQAYEGYVSQFDHAVSPFAFFHRSLFKDYPFLPFMLGADHGGKIFDPDVSLQGIAKKPFQPSIKDRVLVLSSTKSWTQGHRYRLRYISELMSIDPLLFEWFGSGKRRFERKVELLEKYMYVLIIENRIDDWVISEKVLDPLLVGNTIFYLGSSSLSERYPHRIIQLSESNPNESIETIRAVLASNSEVATEGSDYAVEREIIFEEFSIVNRIEKLAFQILSMDSNYGEGVTARRSDIKGKSFFLKREMRRMGRVRRCIYALIGIPGGRLGNAVKREIEKTCEFFYM